MQHCAGLGLTAKQIFSLHHNRSWVLGDINYRFYALEKWFSTIFVPPPMGMQSSGDARDEYLMHFPLPNSSTEECEKYMHCKTPCPDLCHVQKNYATKTSPPPQLRIKKRKKLYESSTTLRNNSKGLKRCKTYEQGSGSILASYCSFVLIPHSSIASSLRPPHIIIIEPVQQQFKLIW